jgi:hypothetical protein
MQNLFSLLAFHNPWWLTGAVPAELNLPFRRPVFEMILSYLKLDRVVILKGPRRTGKSTLMFQFLNHLLQQGIEPRRLFYLPFDDPAIDHSFSDILLEYEKQLSREISRGAEVYCFFDEIQHLEEWSAHLKKYLDKKWPVKFIVSGSSASLIKHGAESLAGRSVEEVILPFSFYEFLLFNMEENENRLLKELRTSFTILAPAVPAQVALLERKIAILFEKYLAMGGFPHLFSVQETLLRKKLLQENVIEKVIYRDLVKRYGIKKPDTLEKMFLYLASQSSDILNITSLANSLKLSREYAQEYLRYLQETYLVMITPRFAPAVETTLRANPKMYLMDVGLINVFSNLPLGKRVESLVARHLYFMNPGYYRNRWEVDFILRVNGHIRPLEVKYRENLEEADRRSLKHLRAKIPFDKAIILTKNTHFTDNNMIGIPTHLFLALI